MMSTARNDFQNKNLAYIGNNISSQKTHAYVYQYTSQNIIKGVIYFSTHHCIEATRLNDRDQFLRPNQNREQDSEFQNDCLAFSLFHGQNRITSRENEGINHRIPFAENQIDARDEFKSHFMTNFIKGKDFSPEAQ